MEKSTNKSNSTNYNKLNVDVKEYRPRRTAAALAEMRARDNVAEQLTLSDSFMVSIFNVGHRIRGECRNH